MVSLTLEIQNTGLWSQPSLLLGAWADHTAQSVDTEGKQAEKLGSYFCHIKQQNKMHGH